MIRYVGHDSNIHLKSLKSDIISVTGVGGSATLRALACMAELWSWVLALVRQCNARLRPAGALQGAGVLLFLSSCHYKILISTAIAASVYPPDPCVTALYHGLRTSNRMGVV